MSDTFTDDQVLEQAAAPSNISLVTDSMADCERLMIDGQAQFILCHHHPATTTALDSAAFLALDLRGERELPAALHFQARREAIDASRG